MAWTPWERGIAIAFTVIYGLMKMAEVRAEKIKHEKRMAEYDAQIAEIQNAQETRRSRKR